MMSDSQLKQDMLAELLAKLMGQSHRTFNDEYGSPHHGVETGLDEAFLIDSATRDALLKADPRSDEILKPFLSSGDITRWRAGEPEEWLIHVPTGTADIEGYPAIKEYLSPYREQLEKRDTSQKWFELLRCLGGKEDIVKKGKITYSHTVDRPTFAHERKGAYLSGVGWMPYEDYFLLGSLNSKLYGLMLESKLPYAEDGAKALQPEHFEALPFPIPTLEQRGAIGRLAEFCQNTTEERVDLHRHVSQEMATNLVKSGSIDELSEKLRNWHFLDIISLSDEIGRHFGETISEEMLPAWEHLLSDGKMQLNILDSELDRAELKIDQSVYEMFALTEEEIEFLENLNG